LVISDTAAYAAKKFVLQSNQANQWRQECPQDGMDSRQGAILLRVVLD